MSHPWSLVGFIEAMEPPSLLTLASGVLNLKIPRFWVLSALFRKKQQKS